MDTGSLTLQKRLPSLQYRLEAWDTPQHWRIGRGANLPTSSDDYVCLQGGTASPVEL